MKISEHTIEFLGKTLCGDNDILFYRTGEELVKFFNQFGENDTYEAGFETRWIFTKDKVRKFNNTKTLKSIIESAVDPRVFIGRHDELKYCISCINEYLKFDGYSLEKDGEFYKIYDLNNNLIEPETINKLDHDFVLEQIKKCQYKIEQGDYNGAITNSRSLVEAVMIQIIEKHTEKDFKNTGNLDKIYKEVKKILNLTLDPEALPPTIIQILSGLESINSGLAGLSNNSGDRHANKFKTSKHHAKLAVNSSLTLVEFLLDSKDYQNEKTI